MNLIEIFLDLLYPPRCTFCRKLLKDHEAGICEKCIERMPAMRTEECRRDIKHVELCVFPFRYEGKVRDSLHRYKFKSATAYGAVYADFIAKSIDENAISCDIISWVPIHKRRMRERGYDQSEIIAKALAVKLGLPCQKLLLKQRNNKRQSTLRGSRARSKNVSDVYCCVAEEELLQGKKVLLVDDIVTTGATVSECASVLKAAGCEKVFAAAVASSVL